jgi:hypothetical protein
VPARHGCRLACLILVSVPSLPLLDMYSQTRWVQAAHRNSCQPAWPKGRCQIMLACPTEAAQPHSARDSDLVHPLACELTNLLNTKLT